MTQVNRGHLAGLKMAHDLAQMSSFPVSWEDSLERLITQASAAPEQEPVAWVNPLNLNRYKGDIGATIESKKGSDVPLYTHADEGEVARLRAENERLNQIINSPQSDDFIRAVSAEAEHQRQRCGSAHDEGKAPSDWFWLVGYLAGKALHSHAAGNLLKAEHHVITTAAAIANWHRSMFGKTDMRPGTAQPADGVKP